MNGTMDEQQQKKVETAVPSVMAKKKKKEWG